MSEACGARRLGDVEKLNERLPGENKFEDFMRIEQILTGEPNICRIRTRAICGLLRQRR